MKVKLSNTIYWSLSVIVLLILMSFISKNIEKEVMSSPNIEILSDENSLFLTQKEILRRLNLSGKWKKNILNNELNIDSIELFLKNMNEVEDAMVYKQPGGIWSLSVKIRKPIARLINKNGKQFYLDHNKKIMFLSNLYSSDVTPVTGNFNFSNKINNNEKNLDIKTSTSLKKLNDIFELLTYIQKDSFLSSQITQINLNQNGDFILIPRVGDQIIVLGKVTNLFQKFRKLKLFYKKAMNKVGWNKYKIINLKYNNQIVCEK